MIPRGVVIERRRRLSLGYRWRDRCLVVMLWGCWFYPCDALRHVLASETFRWSVFVADLAEVASVTAVAVGLTLGWGAYDRWQGRRGRRPLAPGLPETARTPTRPELLASGRSARSATGG